jgi:hypothetical protein
MTYRNLKKITILFLMLIGISNLKAQQQNDGIIYSSPVILTQGMMEKHAQLVQQLLDIAYTPQQKATHFQLIKNYWIQNDYQGIQNITSNLQYAEQLYGLPAEELKATMTQTRSSLIVNLIEDAEQAEDSRWYLQNYLAAHPPLVAGDIPFIKETADALVDCEYFINRDLKGMKVTALTKEQRQAAYKDLGKEWGTFDAGKKKKIMLGVSQMQLIFYRWNKMDALGKANIKLQYVGEQYLTANDKTALRNVRAQNSQLRSQQWGMLQNQLNHMKESTDIIMGRGIRWDPSRNRYVQDGGVVTEFW